MIIYVLVQGAVPKYNSAQCLLFYISCLTLIQLIVILYLRKYCGASSEFPQEKKFINLFLCLLYYVNKLQEKKSICFF